MLKIDALRHIDYISLSLPDYISLSLPPAHRHVNLGHPGALLIV